MLAWLSDPNLMYVLFLAGIYGLLFEVNNPGMFIPGIAGMLCLLLALYAFQYFPTNYYGLGLLTLGLLLIMIEVLASAYGIIAFFGIAAFITGSLFLFDSGQTTVNLSWKIIALMALVSGLFFLMTVNLGIRSMQKKQITGAETLVGKTGEVIRVEKNDCQVRVMGEIWNASAHHILQTGDSVRVLSVKGMLLEVEKI